MIPKNKTSRLYTTKSRALKVRLRSCEERSFYLSQCKNCFLVQKRRSLCVVFFNVPLILIPLSFLSFYFLTQPFKTCLVYERGTNYIYHVLRFVSKTVFLLFFIFLRYGIHKFFDKLYATSLRVLLLPKYKLLGGKLLGNISKLRRNFFLYLMYLCYS